VAGPGHAVFVLRPLQRQRRAPRRALLRAPRPLLGGQRGDLGVGPFDDRRRGRRGLGLFVRGVRSGSRGGFDAEDLGEEVELVGGALLGAASELVCQERGEALL